MEITSSMKILVNDIKEYIGILQESSYDYEYVLSAAVSKYSADLYKDSESLKTAMHEFGASEIQIAKVHVMTLVNGFREVLELDERVQQIDIDRFVQNAIKESGFNAMQVLELVSAIISSLGLEGLADNSRVLKSENEKSGFVVPLSVYEDELMMIEQKFKHRKIVNWEANEIARLEVLARAGIPRAKYYLGSLLLRNEEFENNTQIGLLYLKEAEAAGDSFAAGALGDFYYEQSDSDSWSKAYAYYTGIGSLALNKTRKERVVDILNYRKFNRTTIVASILIAIVMLTTVILAPASSLFAAHQVWGYIFFAVAIAILIVAILHHRLKPYDNLLWVPCLLFILWTLYILIRIIF